MTRYIQVEFGRGGLPYTYDTDDETIVVGDRVAVTTSGRRNEPETKIVTVVAVDVPKPTFNTKSATKA